MIRNRIRVGWPANAAPLLVIAGLFVPGESWAVLEIRTICSLTTVLLLPGYALARSLKLFKSFDNWFDALTLSFALTWTAGLVLWLVFYFAGVPLSLVSLTWAGLAAIGAIVSAFVPLPAQLTGRPARPWLAAAIIAWIIAAAAGAHVYGGQIDGDAYSYMTWLRNIVAGDIHPGTNIHASWEANYPFFKNLFSPTLFYYAMSATLGGVDPSWLWARTPLLWVPIMLAVQFSLSNRIFKKRPVAILSVILAPILFAYAPLSTSSLGDSISLSTYVLLPMAQWLALEVVYRDLTRPDWQMAAAAAAGVGLGLEHFPHLPYYLLNIGMLALLGLLRGRRLSVMRNALLAVFLVIVVSLPFVFYSWRLAESFGYSAADAVPVFRAKRAAFWGGDQLYAVRPQVLLGGQTFHLIAILTLVLMVRYRSRFRIRSQTELPIASFLVVLLIGLNPVLVPFLSRLLAPQTVSRIGQALLVLPPLSYGLLRSAARERAFLRAGKRPTIKYSATLVIFLVLLGYWSGRTTADAIHQKLISIFYGPGDASPILSELVARRVVEAELSAPPYPILDPPARLTHYFDAELLRFIQMEIASDSVFLSERLTELHLPAYTDQLAYLGRFGWPDWGDVCPKVRTDGAEAAFPEIAWPEVRHRLDVACGVLNPDATVDQLRRLLADNQHEIDYILVTPNTAYLRTRLDYIQSVSEVFAGGEFAIYELQAGTNLW